MGEAIMKYAAAILLLLAPRALADVDVVSVLRELGSPEFIVRQRASDKLLADETLSVPQIRKLYDVATLPEQRQRLLEVALHHQVRVVQQSLSQPGGPSSLGVSISSASAASDAGQPA